jgi:hypothetical protein
MVMATTPQRVQLRPEDRERMQRLSEEVQGRLTEMGLIATRTLGLEHGRDTVFKFDPHPPSETDEQATTVEVVVIAVPDGHGGFVFGCYQDPPGVCVFPC